jgi:hypothetical protein
MISQSKTEVSGDGYPEISDRLEINNLLIDYATRSMPRASATSTGSSRPTRSSTTPRWAAFASVAEIKEYLGRVMPHFGARST